MRRQDRIERFFTQVVQTCAHEQLTGVETTLASDVMLEAPWVNLKRKFWNGSIKLDLIYPKSYVTEDRASYSWSFNRLSGKKWGNDEIKFRVLCNRKRHTVTIKKGRMFFLDHPKLEEELAMVALGFPPPKCFTILQNSNYLQRQFKMAWKQVADSVKDWGETSHHNTTAEDFEYAVKRRQREGRPNDGCYDSFWGLVRDVWMKHFKGALDAGYRPQFGKHDVLDSSVKHRDDAFDNKRMLPTPEGLLTLKVNCMVVHQAISGFRLMELRAVHRLSPKFLKRGRLK
jgi:hypothetical protein